MISTRPAIPRAEDVIVAAGQRPTAARQAVLATLLAAERALTHTEIGARLGEPGQFNRVTLYRVLEWLVQHQLAHKIAGEDRVWRFNAFLPEEQANHSHAHFQCNRCGSVTCLEGMSTAFALSLPAGFVSHEAELTIRGLCGGCSGK